MTKMTFDEWIAYETERRQKYKELGVIDINEYRAQKKWGDQNVKDEDIPSTKFTFDAELGQMVLSGDVNETEN